MNLIDKIQFGLIVEHLIDNGYEDEINWSRNIKECAICYDFADEAIWVILNFGMKNQIAQKIWNKIRQAWNEGKSTASAFGHKGKVAAIDYIRGNSSKLFNEYCKAENKVEFLKTLPWIGNITCWHLAKNLGLNVVKPDRWLVRVANAHNMTPDALCEEISKITGETKHTVDLIIWRACNIGLISI